MRILLTINGVTKTPKEWAVVEGAAPLNTIVYRYRKGLPHDTCVFKTAHEKERFPPLTALSAPWRKVAEYPICDLGKQL